MRDDAVTALAISWPTLDQAAKEAAIEKIVGVELVHTGNPAGRSRLGGSTVRLEAETPYGLPPEP